MYCKWHKIWQAQVSASTCFYIIFIPFWNLFIYLKADVILCPHRGCKVLLWNANEALIERFSLKGVLCMRLVAWKQACLEVPFGPWWCIAKELWSFVEDSVGQTNLSHCAKNQYMIIFPGILSLSYKCSIQNTLHFFQLISPTLQLSGNNVFFLSI